MENSIKCPYCAEEIPSAASVCPYCGETLGRKNEPEETKREEAARTDNLPSESPKEPETVIEVHNDGKFYDIFNYSGRLDRKKYWIGMLATYVVFGGIVTLLVVAFSLGFTFDTITSIIMGIYALGMILSSVSATVRRLNDAGNEYEWYKFIAYLPLIGPLLLVVPLSEEGLPQTPVRINLNQNPDDLYKEIFAGLPETATVDDKVMAILKKESKIAAMKYYKDVSGCSLMDAKDYVDILEQQNK